MYINGGKKMKSDSGVHVCLAVTCHLHLSRMTGMFYVLLLRYHGGGTDTQIRLSQHTKLTREKKIPPPLLPGLETRDLSITSPALYLVGSGQEFISETPVIKYE